MADWPRHSDSDRDIDDYPGAPRWVKVFGVILVVLVLLFIVAKLTGIGGRHGPGRHLRSGGAGGSTAAPGLTETPTPTIGRAGRTPSSGLTEHLARRSPGLPDHTPPGDRG